MDPSLPTGIGQLDQLDETVAAGALRCFIEFACQTQNFANIELGRAALFAAPRAWVLSRLLPTARSVLDFNDAWEARRLLEISGMLDPELGQALAADLKSSQNEEVREAAGHLVPQTTAKT